MNLPVDGALPEAVVHAIEDVEEHRSGVARCGPVIRRCISAGILSLESVATAVDYKGYREEETPSDLSTETPTEELDIKTPAHERGTENLS